MSAAAEMRADAAALRDLAESWKTYPSPEQYGALAKEYGEGIAARMELVAAWAEHCADRAEQVAALRVPA